jgi:hypothetical protein
MPAELVAPIDRMAHWNSPDGASLRVRIREHLDGGGALEALVPDLDLCGIDLRGARLSGADLSRARLAHARLDGADLTRARLDGALLRGASAMGAKLDGASLACADLSLGNYTRASLRLAVLVGARLDGAVFHAADLSGADLRGASYAGCDFEDAWLIGVCGERRRAPARSSQAEAAAEGGFPTFLEAYRAYVRLLRVAAKELWIVETCVLVSQTPEAEVLALFRGRNWRTHLVGATAMLAGVASPAVLGQAWERLDDGSWIAPQLAATLLLTDGAFEPRARARLLQAISPPTPASQPPRLPPRKAVASLAAAYRRAPGADRGLLDALDVLERAGQLDEAGALKLTETWLKRVVEEAPDRMRAGWRCVPGP